MLVLKCILVSWIARLLMKAEEPERLLELNVRAVIRWDGPMQMESDGGWRMHGRSR